METKSEQLRERIIKKIKEYTGHEYVILTPRGTKAIKIALKAVKERCPEKTNLLIPDQGGWLTYTQFPKKVGLFITEMKTDYGVADIDDLKRVVNMNKLAAVIFSNPAGYYAHQPISEIYENCRDKCIVIMDVAGCIGNQELCKGEFADIMVGSFGKWKPVNAGKGGFISFKEKGLYEIGKIIYGDTPELKKNEFANIYKKLIEAPERINFFFSECKKIKKELSDFDVLHSESKGIIVIVRFSKEDEKNRIIGYCEKNKYEYTLCPRYIRVNENAVSIEVKRM